jgi:biotin operon repressor
MSKTTKFGGPFLAFPRWALEALKGDYVAIAVLLQILMYLNTDTQTTTTSYDYIAEQIGVSRRTVIRCVKRLESTGVLVKKVRKGVTTEKNLSNEYRVKFDNPNAFEVVTPESPYGDTRDTTCGDTSDTTVVTPVSPKQEYKNKSNIKSNRTKRKKSDFDDVEVDIRWGN